MTQQSDNNSQGLMIELKDMNKWYGEFHVLKNINLEVRKGEKIVICGPSGSGKSKRENPGCETVEDEVSGPQRNRPEHPRGGTEHQAYRNGSADEFQ